MGIKFFEDKNIRAISKWDAKAAWLYESEEDYHLRMTGGLDMYDMYEEREEENIYDPDTNKRATKEINENKKRNIYNTEAETNVTKEQGKMNDSRKRKRYNEDE